MSDLYGKTTESLESLNNISCASRVTCGTRSSNKKASGKSKPADDTEMEMTPVEQDVVEKEDNFGESSVLMSPNEDSTLSPAKKRFQDIAKRATLANKYANRFIIDDPEKRKQTEIRRKQHLNKFSKLRTDDNNLRRAAVEPDSRPATRDNAAKVLFRAGVKKIQTKPNLNIPAWRTFGGRSFKPSDLSAPDDDDDGNEFVDLTSFFEFGSEGDIYNQIVPKRESFTTAEIPKSLKLQERKRKKPRFFMGTLLGGRMKKLKRSIELSNSLEKREYFTIWLSFVQLVILIVMLCLYPFAPIGKDVKVVKKEVILSREGVLLPEQLSRKVVESFWLGPSLESLILLGAKYAPCMRRDKLVFDEIKKERKKENDTGCCLSLQNTGCIQRSREHCMSSSVEFKPKTVCGQDPKFCISASISPTKWDPNTITSWPKCEKFADKKRYQNVRHMTCEITGRPCCIKTQGQCVITTEQNCKFWDGIYHGDANLCSQVDCIGATCGNSFTRDDYPDQIHRLFLSLFLNAGILHLVIVLIFNLTIVRYIELFAGWWRTGMIFLLTGMGGNLWSAVLLPYQAEVGESGAMFGLFACIFVEGIQSWTFFNKPWHYMGKLIGILFIMLLFGLLPYVDNYAHIFGFIYGILCGFLFLPHVVTKEGEDEIQKEKIKYLIIRVVCFLLLLVLTILAFILFYITQDTQSPAIAYFNCPLGEQFCQNFHQGMKIETREIEY